MKNLPIGIQIMEFKVVDNKNQNGKALEQIKENKNICKFEWERIV